MAKGKPRDLSTRDFETRAALKEEMGLLHVEPRQGYMIRWISMSVNGQPNTQRSITAHNEGWRPVRYADYPDFDGGIGIADIMNGKTSRTSDEYIVVNGLTLCEMPTIMYKRLKDKKRRDAESGLDHIKKALNETAGATDLPYESSNVIGDDSTGRNFL